MTADRNFGNTSPLAWAGSIPVYASTLLAGAHALAMVATALAMFAGAKLLLGALEFSSAAVCGHFAIWQLGTYAFVHPPGLLFLLELYMLVAFGQEIEKLLGRRAFLVIYLTLLLAPPLALALAGFAGFPSSYWGSGALHFGIFVAFAALYPSAEVFFGIQARWVAACLVAVSALQSLAASDTTGLAVLALDCSAAVLLVRRLRGGELFPDLRSFFPARPTPHLRVLERPDEPAASIDDILEKISRRGMRSLTAGERARLDRAREELLEKDRKR
ncbi:MAG: rhomboid family intramembrane serine protease [Verrucomicrobiae bacterium]